MIRTEAVRPVTSTAAPSAVAAIVSIPSVPLTVTVSAWLSGVEPPRPAGEIDVDLRQIGAGHVVDGDRVGPVERVDVDRLDAVEVHHDVAEVPGEVHPLADGRRRHDLVAGRAVEDERVEAPAAVDDVRAVARVPHEGVVALTEEGRVDTAVAVCNVVAATAEEQLVAASADERVIAVLAKDLRSLGGR